MKYTVEVGGLVTACRSRKIIVYADNKENAMKKAADKFKEIQYGYGYDCDSVHIDAIDGANIPLNEGWYYGE